MHDNSYRSPLTGRFEKTPSRNKPCSQCGKGPDVGRGLCRVCYGKFWYQRAKDTGKFMNGQYITSFEERKSRTIRKKRALRLKKCYGMGLEEYEAILASQNGLCAICHRPEQRSNTTNLSVDHDHSTGRIRGLLCTQCNTALGMFREEPSILASAIGYLARSQSSS